MPQNCRLLIVSPVSSWISRIIESTTDSLLSTWPPGKISPFEFDVEIPKVVDESDLRRINLELLECRESEGKSLVRFCVHKLKSADEDGDESTSFTVVPFQIAYAVSIHKAQGLEYDSVKIVF